MSEQPSGEPVALALVAAVNDYRATQGLGPLAHDPSLDLAARQFTDHLADGGAWAHDSAAAIAARVKAAGYEGAWSGEVLAQGAADGNAAAAVQQWIGDRPHRVILLSKFAKMGGAVTRTDRVSYWCVDFGI